MNSEARPWICCQLGSREHYAIPRVLHREGLLSLLLTDYWSHHSAALRSWPLKGLQKLAERHHYDLDTAKVADIGLARLQFDLQARRKKWSPWETTLRRNEWFQARILQQLQRKLLSELHQQPPGFFFAYSYAARHLLRFFQQLGWTTILGQIDPAIREEEIVAEEAARHPELSASWERAPSSYWEAWRQEIAASDLVTVNSAWSRQALLERGVPESKVHVLPLAYEAQRPNPAE
jgi:hypothetical protein